MSLVYDKCVKDANGYGFPDGVTDKFSHGGQSVNRIIGPDPPGPARGPPARLQGSGLSGGTTSMSLSHST